MDKVWPLVSAISPFVFLEGYVPFNSVDVQLISETVLVVNFASGLYAALFIPWLDFQVLAA